MTSSEASRKEREKRNLAAGLTATGKPRQRKRRKPGGRYQTQWNNKKRRESTMSQEELAYRTAFRALLDRLTAHQKSAMFNSPQGNADVIREIITTFTDADKAIMAGIVTTETTIEDAPAAPEGSVGTTDLPEVATS